MTLSVLPLGADPLKIFPEWVVAHCNTTTRALEIGAGRGDFGYPQLIRKRVCHLTGVDPDKAVLDNPYVDEAHQMSVEEFSRGHAQQFDCAYAFFVVEHVTEPARFLSACRTVLKPGGMFFALTPNLWHYFGMMAKVSSALNLEDWLLTRLRGHDVKQSYHFPTRYRLNDVRTIRRLANVTGFRKVEIRCFDMPERFASYLPTRLHWGPSLYGRTVHALHLPQFMGFLMFKAIV